MSQAYYRKWRPQKWDQVVGQQHVVQTLHNAVTAERVAHAYLFAGPRGTGKTSVARLLAKAVNCLDEDLSKRPCDQCDHCLSVNQARFLDLIEIDAASNTSVEDIRDLRDKINFSPNLGRYKVYIIDEVHMLSTAAFNALLKTLEEPPPHAIFILATTEVHKIPATVLSRCQRHEFRRIPVVDIIKQLKMMAEAEGLKIEAEALSLIARQATGAMRDAISLLDQLASADETITLEMTQTVLGTATTQSVLDLMDALLAKDSAAGLDQVHATLDAGSDPRQFTRQIVNYLRDVLLVRMGNADQVDATADTRAKMAQHAQAIETTELLRIIRAFNAAATEARGNWQPSLPLELAFVEAIEAPQTAPAPAVLQSAPAAAQSAPSRPVPTPKSKPKPPAAKPSAPAEKAAPPQPVAEGGFNLQAVNQNWKQILGAVKRLSPNTYGLLNSCTAKDVQDGALFLGFASDILKEKMEKNDHLNQQRQAMNEVLGEEVTVRCMVASSQQGSLPPEVGSSGMVAQAVRLGGEVVSTTDLNNKEEGE